MASKPTLGYWDIRGFCEPIRFILNYAGVEFNDKRYQFGKGSSLAEWESIIEFWAPEKAKLNIDFPNLPYYIDGDVKLTQSFAIMRYLARKYGLWAKDERSLIRQDVIEQQLYDFRLWHTVRGLFYNPEFEKIKDNVISEKIPEQLKLLSNVLGQNQWFIGDTLTHVDFIAYESFDWLRTYKSDIFESFPNLKSFIERFENIPQISAHIKSDRFKKWPIFSPLCQWGYKKNK